ncbi:DUF4395 domain-containing protein [Parapedobacter sp. GCM10030251]|uniref:DUF4395 domain-containing protein n=1 Tax=Parapedobacter sp. GCM10030251 TaxID=3273419 RepID=UPI00360FEDC6
MENTGLDSPDEPVTVNVYQARWVAFLVSILTIGYLASGYWFIPTFLVPDFFLRASQQGNYSLLERLSDVLLNVFRMGNSPVDRAPRRFAVWVGFLFAGAIAILYGIGASSISYILADVLVIFAILEAAFGFCVGCRIYTIVKSLLPSRSQ